MATSTKTELRVWAKEKRHGITSEELERASAAVQSRLEKLVADLTTIAIYSPIQNELNLTSLCSKTTTKTWLLPRVVSFDGADATMEFAPISEPLKLGPYGIHEPTGVAVKPEQIEAVIAPGLAFDLDGNRLGFGAGFYDRWLSDRRKLGHVLCVGVAMDWQLVAQVPHETNDVKMNYIVTELQCIQCHTEEEFDG